MNDETYASIFAMPIEIVAPPEAPLPVKIAGAVFWNVVRLSTVWLIAYAARLGWEAAVT